MGAILLECLLLVALAVVALSGIAGGYTWIIWTVLVLDCLLLIRRIIRLSRNRLSPLPHVDETFNMSGEQFEQYVLTLYRRLGKRAVVVGGSGDQGIDIIVGRVFKTGVQVKCYSGVVGNKAVQEAAAGRKFHRLTKAVVVTNSIFSKSAKELARRTRVKLIDRKNLAAMVKKANIL